MKKIFQISIICIFCLFISVSCIKKDKNTDNIKKETYNSQEKTIFPPKAKTVTINNVDYLQSQAPVGRFGGNLISSTIGEGPKTFNPFNTKDATSAAMAEVMYDGLLTTDAQTGEVIPKLAKSYSISPDGKTYTINLRKGIK